MKKVVFLTYAFLIVFTANAMAQTAANRSTPVPVGGVAPDFTLSDTDGRPVTLSKVRQPTVLVFYRGYW